MDAVDIAELQLEDPSELATIDLETVTGGVATTARPPITVSQQWGKVLPFVRPGNR